MSTKKLSLALIALLALAPLLAYMPVQPASAAVVTPRIKLDYPYATINQTNITRYIIVENPSGNPDITEIRIYVPKESMSNLTHVEGKGFTSATSFSITGVGPWTIVGSAGGATVLPDGATGKIIAMFDNVEVKVGKYELKVKVKFADGSEKDLSLYLYEGNAIMCEVDIAEDEVLAGGKISVKVQLKDAYGVVDEAVPVIVWAKSAVGAIDVGTYTTSKGEASFSYTLTKAATWTFYADVAKEYESTKATLSRRYDSVEVKAGAPTKVIVNTPFDRDGYAISYLTDSSFPINVTVTDKYGNPVAMEAGVTADVTLTATKGTLANTTTTISAGSNTSKPVIYKPDPLYGTYAMISAKVIVPSGTYKGTYSGTSKSLSTSTFANTASIAVVPTTLEVEAGKYATITVTLGIPQKGVPVKFEVTAEDYVGTFSPVSTTTDENGKATTKFYVDTKANKTTKVKAIISKPVTTDPTATLPPVESDTIKTIPGAIYKLGIEAPKAVEPEGTDILTIYLADKYGNKAANNTFGAVIRVTLSATGGTLEETTVDIDVGAVSTTVKWTAPAVLGNYTITASTTQYGLASASATILVTTLEPTVNITQPATDVTIKTLENVTTVYIAGWAKPSPAAAAGTVISLFKYSLDKGANVSVPIVKIEDTKAFFNFSLTLEVNKTYTVTVYAIDSAGYEAKASRRITVTYAPPPPVMPATITAAKTDKPSYKTGEEARITGTITNNATVSKDVIIRITFIDPTGVPQYPIYELRVTLAPGQSITPTATYLAGITKGTWTAKIMVIDAVTGEAIAEPITLTVTVV